jgi:hypothetical protein
LVGENDENKWNKKKPLVYWSKVGKEDIGNYEVGNKIKSTFHGASRQHCR